MQGEFASHFPRSLASRSAPVWLADAITTQTLLRGDVLAAGSEVSIRLLMEICAVDSAPSVQCSQRDHCRASHLERERELGRPWWT